MWLYILFIHSSLDGHLCCFFLSAIMNAAAIIMFTRFCMDMSFHFSWVYIPRSGLLGHITLCLIVWGTVFSLEELFFSLFFHTGLFSQVAAHFALPTASYEFQFLCIPVSTLVSLTFWF